MKTYLPSLRSTPSLLCALAISALASSAAAGDKQPPISHPAVAPAEPDADRPLPFGLGVFYLYQEQDIKLTGLDADMPTLKPPRITKLPPGVIPPGLPEPYASQAYATALKAAQEEANRRFAEEMARLPKFDKSAIRRVRNEVQHVNAKLDWWALPFLNLHVHYGQFEGKGTATLAPELASLFGNLSAPYDGQSYGGGITLAAGWRKIFASVTADYAWSDVDLKAPPGIELEDPEGVETFFFTPRIGYRFDNLSVWAGAQYQSFEHTEEGSFTMEPLGKIPFSASVEDASHWNAVVGLEWRLNPHWSLTAEGGFGPRKQVIAGVTYRF